MININTQAKFTLQPFVDGTKLKLTGEQLFNSREIHGLPDSKFTITTTTDSDVYILGTGEYVSTRPVYTETTAKYNGALDGGLAVVSLDDAEFGTHSTKVNAIGGEDYNRTIILDSKMNELLLPDGSQVYALVGAKASAMLSTGKPVDDSLQLSFVTMETDGTYTPYVLPAGTYTYGINGIYAWATARHRELPNSGSNTISVNVGGTSRGEILTLIEDNLDMVGYLNVTVLADADIEPEEGYTVTFNLKKDGTSAPTVSIVGIDTGNSTVPNAISTAGTGIQCKTGLAVLSNVTAYFNGVAIKPQLVSITVSNNDVTVMINNSTKQIADGLLVTEDSYTIVYATPNEATL